MAFRIRAQLHVFRERQVLTRTAEQGGKAQGQNGIPQHFVGADNAAHLFHIAAMTDDQLGKYGLFFT